MSQQVKQAVILCAGWGSRFLPATKSIPKSILPIVDRPIIDWLTAEALSSGIEQIILVVGQNSQSIQDYLRPNHQLEKVLATTGKKNLLELVRQTNRPVKFVQQAGAFGTGDGLKTARPALSPGSLAFFYGDDLFFGPKPAIGQLIDLYSKHKTTIVGVSQVSRESVGRYGVVEGQTIAPRLLKISRFVEKPSPGQTTSRLVSSGRMILEPDIFDQLERTPKAANGELQLADAVASLVAQKGGLAYQMEGRYFDCGNKLEYVKAIVEAAKSHSDIGPAFTNWLTTQNRQL